MSASCRISRKTTVKGHVIEKRCLVVDRDGGKALTTQMRVCRPRWCGIVIHVGETLARADVCQHVQRYNTIRVKTSPRRPQVLYYIAKHVTNSLLGFSTPDAGVSSVGKHHLCSSSISSVKSFRASLQRTHIKQIFPATTVCSS